MIAVKSAIESGAWYRCLGEESDSEYRIRIASFKKVPLSQEKLRQYNIDKGGSFWLMEIELVNLEKKQEFAPPDFHEDIYLQDQDGFTFNYVNSSIDSQIINDDKWENRLQRFWITGPRFQAKTKAVGIIAFFLPEDTESEYYFCVNGSIAEV